MLKTASNALTLSRDLMIAPSKAVRRFKDSKAALPEAVYLYGLFMLLSILFYTIKPSDFPPPDPGMEFSRALGGLSESQGLFFWTKVELWNPALSVIWALFLAWLLDFLKRSKLRLPMTLLLAAIFGLLPVVPIVLYNRDVIPRFALVLFWIALLGMMIPSLKKRNRASWKPLIAVVLTIDVINLALLIPFIIAVILRHEGMYTVLEMVMVFWTLGLGTYLISKLEDLSTSRAFVAIFISLLYQIWFVFSLFFLGLVPKDILKALMSV